MIIPTERLTEEENRELDELEATSGDTIPGEEESARIRERLRKAAAETDALRTPSPPRYDNKRDQKTQRTAINHHRSSAVLRRQQNRKKAQNQKTS